MTDGYGAQLHAAGVQRDAGAVTWQGKNVGTIWKDDAGWWWGADGISEGPYANEILAMWALWQDFKREQDAI